MIFLSLLLLATCSFALQAKEDELCRNRFVYLSSYVLGLQTDLKKAVDEINTIVKIDEVFYQADLYKSYRIFNIRQTISYNQGNQTGRIDVKNVYKVTGGTVKISYAFSWTKTQLGSSLEGNGTGSVTSEIISYEKTMHTNNETHELQWVLTYSQPLQINNGLSLSTMEPYRAADYQILSNMLNKLKNSQPTVKQNLLKAINPKLQAILYTKVQEDELITFDKTIFYPYSDYRGYFNMTFSNILVDSTLVDSGLYLMFSQKIIGYDEFECGEPVPFVPNDPSVFGGLQQFYSTSLIKSTLRYAIKIGALNVILKEESWQSRAFQFYIGDLHDVMPSSTRKISSYEQIQGRCDALDDPVFSFAMKNSKAYEAKVNFACRLFFNKTIQLIGINLVANYQISPRLSSKALDFQLTGLTGTPAFVETDPFIIEYQELADFMVGETINLAKSGFVFGSNYKLKYPKKYPILQVRKSYLFMSDSSRG